MEHQRLEAPVLDVTGRAWVVPGPQLTPGEPGTVRLEGIRPSMTGPTLAAFAGVFAVIAGVRMALTAGGAGEWSPLQLLPGLEVMVAGLLVVAVGTVVWRRERMRWKVVETTPFGERVVLTTRDHALAERVLSRFDEARAAAESQEVTRWRA